MELRRRPNCKHDPRAMDFIREERRPGALLEIFFCKQCRRRMWYWTRPNFHTKKATAEISATSLVMDEAFNDRRAARAADVYGLVVDRPGE